MGKPELGDVDIAGLTFSQLNLRSKWCVVRERGCSDSRFERRAGLRGEGGAGVGMLVLWPAAGWRVTGWIIAVQGIQLMHAPHMSL
jgi:hypothetical protein